MKIGTEAATIALGFPCGRLSRRCEYRLGGRSGDFEPIGEVDDLAAVVAQLLDELQRVSDV